VTRQEEKRTMSIQNRNALRRHAPMADDRGAVEEFLEFFPELPAAERRRIASLPLAKVLAELERIDPEFAGLAPPPKAPKAGSNPDREVIEDLLDAEWRNLPRLFRSRLVNLPLAEAREWLASLGKFGERFRGDLPSEGELGEVTAARKFAASGVPMLAGAERDAMDRAMGIRTAAADGLGLRRDGTFALSAISGVGARRSASSFGRGGSR
jgi:hypothetical protein